MPLSDVFTQGELWTHLGTEVSVLPKPLSQMTDAEVIGDYLATARWLDNAKSETTIEMALSHMALVEQEILERNLLDSVCDKEV